MTAYVEAACLGAYQPCGLDVLVERSSLVLESLEPVEDDVQRELELQVGVATGAMPTWLIAFPTTLLHWLQYRRSGDRVSTT